MNSLTTKLLSLLVMLALLTALGCKKEPVPDPDPDPTDELVILEGDLETRTLEAAKKYLLRGQVFVRSGRTLKVEPGTVIFGDKRTRATLIIDKGGKLEAKGRADAPIVFTSNQEAGIRDRGDWGGLVIIGNANVNQPSPGIEGITPAVIFGTTNSKVADAETSGTLEYVRVEFGGIELTPNNETNSITMGGVGRGTKMEYCMVSFGGDDGFEWFGGTNDGKYLISFATWDDDFDCDFGWSGNVQYGLVVRYPGFADQSQSNGFECDNGPNDNDQPRDPVTGDPTAPDYSYTTGTFSNITVLGPIKTGTTISNANYAHAIDLRRRVAVSIFNSVFTGFPRGLRFNQASVYNNYVNGLGVLENNLMFGPTAGNTYQAGSGVVVDSVKNYWEARNQTIVGAFEDAAHTTAGIKPDWFFGSRLADAYPSDPDFRVTSGTLTTGAKFDNPKFNEPNRSAFFNKTVQFRGAFGGTDWTNGWAEFDPVDKEY